MADPILEIRNLTVGLPQGADREKAVENVTLTLMRGETLCIVGESGSGKTVIGQTIIGLTRRTMLGPTTGEIIFDGEDLLRAANERLREIRGNRIAMIFQEPTAALNPLMTIGRQLEELLTVHRRMSRSERRQRIFNAFTDVALPEPERMIRSYPHQLSGGQCQRAVIAMALMLEPDVIIADEPTTALDVTTQAQILSLLKKIRTARQTSFIFITHDFGVVAEMANRVAVMQRGRVVEVGNAEKVLRSPSEAYTQALLVAVPSMVPPEARDTGGAPIILALKGLGKSYRRGRKKVNALRDVSLTLRRGETVGIVGESGSGKSTIARSIVRLVECERGVISFENTDLRQLSRRQMRPYRKRIQMVFQDPFSSLNPRLTAGELIAQGPVAFGEPFAKALSRAKELMRLVGLGEAALDRYPNEFSGGQRQRIGLARALALRPEILIADEPVSALDVSIQAQILELFADIRRQMELAMIFITHDLRVAAQLCDRVAVMRQGEIVEEGPTARIFGHPSHSYTRELLDAVPGKAWETTK